MRECEVIVGTTSNCLPTSVPVLPILHRAILYSLHYLYSFLPIIRLFYLTRCLHPKLLLLSIQPGILFTYDYLNPPEYKTKYFLVNSISLFLKPKYLKNIPQQQGLNELNML